MERLVALVEEKAHTQAVRVGIRGLFALCLAKENRHRAVSAGAASELSRRITEGGAREPERALAAVEQLCRAEGRRDAVVAGAMGGLAAVTALVRAMFKRAMEHAAGALVAVVDGSEALQVEVVRAGAMSQLLLMVQGRCSERAKRKARHLLKLLRFAWPTTDCIANSDNFLQPTDRSPPVRGRRGWKLRKKTDVRGPPIRGQNRHFKLLLAAVPSKANGSGMQGQKTWSSDSYDLVTFLVAHRKLRTL
jgi:hypothetical protein